METKIKELREEIKELREQIIELDIRANGQYLSIQDIERCLIKIYERQGIDRDEEREVDY